MRMRVCARVCRRTCARRVVLARTPRHASKSFSRADTDLQIHVSTSFLPPSSPSSFPPPSALPPPHPAPPPLRLPPPLPPRTPHPFPPSTSPANMTCERTYLQTHLTVSRACVSHVRHVRGRQSQPRCGAMHVPAARACKSRHLVRMHSHTVIHTYVRRTRTSKRRSARTKLAGRLWKPRQQRHRRSKPPRSLPPSLSCSLRASCGW